MSNRTRILTGADRDWIRPKEAVARLAEGLGGHKAGKAVLVGLLSQGKLIARASRILTETYSDLAAVAGRQSRPGTQIEDLVEKPPKALIVDPDFWSGELTNSLELDDLGPWFEGNFTTKLDVGYAVETKSIFEVRMNLGQIERLIPGNLSIRDGRRRSGNKRSSNWDLWTAEFVKLARAPGFKIWENATDVEKTLRGTLEAKLKIINAGEPDDSRRRIVDQPAALRTVRETLKLLRAGIVK